MFSFFKKAIPQEVAESLKNLSEDQILDIIFRNHPVLDRRLIRTGSFDIQQDHQKGYHIQSGRILELFTQELVLFIGLNDGMFRYPQIAYGSLITEVIYDPVESRRKPHTILVVDSYNIKTIFDENGKPITIRPNP